MSPRSQSSDARPCRLLLVAEGIEDVRTVNAIATRVAESVGESCQVEWSDCASGELRPYAHECAGVGKWVPIRSLKGGEIASSPSQGQLERVPRVTRRRPPGEEYGKLVAKVLSLLLMDETGTAGVLCFDTDRDQARAVAAREVRGAHADKHRVLLGIAEPLREAWILSARRAGHAANPSRPHDWKERTKPAGSSLEVKRRCALEVGGIDAQIALLESSAMSLLEADPGDSGLADFIQEIRDHMTLQTSSPNE